MKHSERRPCCSLTRREFVQAAGAFLAPSSALPVNSMAEDLSVSERTHRTAAFEYGNPLSEFRYGDVDLAACLQQAQFEQTHGILISMNEDSLLRPFRMAAELPAPGNDLGGWYSAKLTPDRTGPIGPMNFGQWISALSRYFATTGDTATQRKVQRLIEGYAEAIEPKGRMFQITQDPDYLYDKLVCGLLDAYELAGVNSAIPLISRTTDSALPHLAREIWNELRPEGQTGRENYTLPENQFIAWQRGAGERHLKIAKHYLADDFYFTPLARGLNVLPGRHAYSHVNALCSAAKAYLVLGNPKYLRAAINGFTFVEQQSFATGGWGPNEHFLPRAGYETLRDALDQTRSHFETPCGAYAHFKLTRYLLRITKDPSYGDSMERIMYNTALGALSLNKFGKAFYNSDYHHHAQKEYFDGYNNTMEDEWPCCAGTLPQLAADYRISTYFSDEQGIFVNLYIPSTLRWRQNGVDVALTQSGQYPLADEVAFELKVSKPARFTVRLRIPEWTEGASVHLNGSAIAESVREGAFAMIRRRWRSGDRLVLKLPRRLKLKAVDAQHPDLVALVSGPLVLFALSDDTPKVTRDQLLAAKQMGAGEPQWQVDSASGPMRFVPFWTIKDETYFTYLNV